MIFNGNRSYIHSGDSIANGSPPYKLYIEKKGEHNVLVKSLILLEENLMKINRGLGVLKDKENIHLSKCEGLALYHKRRS